MKKKEEEKRKEVNIIITLLLLDFISINICSIIYLSVCFCVSDCGVSVCVSREKLKIKDVF